MVVFQYQEWIGRRGQIFFHNVKFTNYLNSEQADSVQSLLHAASCDTLFNKIAGAETKKIARVAMELSSLIENLKGYLHTVETGPGAGPAR